MIYFMKCLMIPNKTGKHEQPQSTVILTKLLTYFYVTII